MSIIRCPNCKSALGRFENMLRCEKGHSFDFSKEGYVNLLLPNQKKKLNPGDNKIMVNARVAFLEASHYDFLIDAIENSLNALSIFENKKMSLLDLGCGIGYYLRELFKGKGVIKAGVDISKVGVAKASKKDKKSTYIVGSVFDLPINDQLLDVAINIFSPISIHEVGRVLKPGGYFIKVIPTKDHMKEVAELVYDSFVPHTSSIESELAVHAEAEIVETKELEQKITFKNVDLINLVSMTPYLFKFKEGELEQLKELEVTIGFRVIVVKFGEKE